MIPSILRRLCAGFLCVAALASTSSEVAAHQTILTPNGPEVLIVGEQATISWIILLEHDTINWDMHYSIDGGVNWLLLAKDVPALGDLSPGTLHTYDFTVTPAMISNTVRFKLKMDNLFSPDMIDVSDDDTIVTTGPWADIGNALPGAQGTAQLAGSGDLTPGSPGVLTLDGAAASAPVTLFMSGTTMNQPFRGGTMVPGWTLFTVQTATDSNGSMALPFNWPLGAVQGDKLIVQAWWPDAGGPDGAAASNATVLATP